jgi:predicted deacylase
MARMLAKPAAVDFVTPGRRDYHVTIEHPTIWGHFLIPLTVMVGPNAEAGRGVFASGATHGNELEGPVAIKSLLREIDIAAVRGRIVLCPVLNVAAFKAMERETPFEEPSSGNLNRAFPGKEKGNYTARVADFVNRLLFPHVHVVYDIHSGGRVGRFEPLTSFHHLPDPEQLRMTEQHARAFGCKFTMVYQDETPGLLCSTAEKLGKITVGTELGFGAAVNRRGVAMARQGILWGCIKSGQLNGALPTNEHVDYQQQIKADTSDPQCSIIAPFNGIFEPTVDVDVSVEQGDLLGLLHDFDRVDDAGWAIRAPHDGPVIMQAWEAAVEQGQIITQVGQPQAWSTDAPA